MNIKTCLIFVSLSLWLGVGCGQPTDSVKAPLGKKMESLRWSSSDAPSIFQSGLEYDFSKLPTTGKPAQMAWAGGYWPTYKDSINHKWDGAATDSPTKKYEKAFGKTNLEEQISKKYGILSYNKDGKGKVCAKDEDCDPGRKCGIRDGETSGFCVHSWVGICHGWAPAAALIKEPVRDVTHKGVTFKINDLKALLSLLYTSLETKFVSLRCNLDDAKGEIKYDVYGRPLGTNKQCQDTNPGTYHVILANFLGIKKQSFVEDRIADTQVWNHPVVGYRITSKKEVTPQEANRLVATRFGGSVEKEKWHHYKSFTVKEGDSFKVVMTGNGDVDLHVRFGSEPTDKEYDCRPYEDGSSEVCDIKVPQGATEVFVSVLGYAKWSTYELQLTLPTNSPSSTYLFNDKATKLYHVKLEVDYITESESTTGGNLSSQIAKYIYTDAYEYILEVDASGKINGGEWLGSSKRNHPDFLWLPGKLRSNAILGGQISYADLKPVLDKATAPEPGSNSQSWNGNGSIISFSSGTATGYGLTYDVSRIHPTSTKNPAVFFQWEVDVKDGAKLKITAPGMEKATIIYGSWGSRAKDRMFKEVKLPFVLDPAKDGFDAKDGNWYVIQVAFAKKPTKMLTVKAEATNKAASSDASVPAVAKDFDGTHEWNGNGSIISFSSGTATGYGLTYDVSRIHPTSAKNPAVLFQWELAAADGAKLKITAPDGGKATITYGSWGSRAKDKVFANVTLPFTIDPKADGFDGKDGSWYVIRVAFAGKPSKTITVKAEAVK